MHPRGESASADVDSALSGTKPFISEGCMEAEGATFAAQT